MLYLNSLPDEIKDYPYKQWARLDETCFVGKDHHRYQMFYLLDDNTRAFFYLASITTDGLKMLAKYYQYYCDLNICIVTSIEELIMELKFLQSTRKALKGGFLLKIGDEAHSTPFIYEQHVQQDVVRGQLFQFDSVPENIPSIYQDFLAIRQLPNMTHYSSTINTQVDGRSCATGAMFVIVQALQLKIPLVKCVVNLKKIAADAYSCTPPPQCLLLVQKPKVFEEYKLTHPRTYQLLQSYFKRHKDSKMLVRNIDRSTNNEEIRFINLQLNKAGFLNIIRISKIQAKNRKSRLKHEKVDDRYQHSPNLKAFDEEIAQVTQELEVCVAQDLKQTWGNWLCTFFISASASRYAIGKDPVGVPSDEYQFT